MCKRIVVEEKPGLYVSELFPNLYSKNKTPQPVEGQPPPPFNPAPLREFLRVMSSPLPPSVRVSQRFRRMADNSAQSKEEDSQTDDAYAKEPHR